MSASPKSCNSLAAMFACRDYNPLHHILVLIRPRVFQHRIVLPSIVCHPLFAIRCLPSKDMAVKRNKMSAGVKQQ
jgi:hypothetical protein